MGNDCPTSTSLTPGHGEGIPVVFKDSATLVIRISSYKGRSCWLLRVRTELMGTHTLCVMLGMKFMGSFPHQNIRLMGSSWSLGSSVSTYRQLQISSLTPSRQSRLLCKVFTATWEARAVVRASHCLVLVSFPVPSVLTLQPATRSHYTPRVRYCLALQPLGVSGRAGTICLWPVIVLFPQWQPWDAVKYQCKFAVADFLLWQRSAECCQHSCCSFCAHSSLPCTALLTELPKGNCSAWVKELSFDP